MSDFSLKPYIENHKKIHLVGIGGVSMSALAELLVSKGVQVTGSDRTETPVTDKLEGLGIQITYAHLPENVEHTDLVIRTAAVHDENPEIARALELGLPVIERAQAWGSIMLEYHNVICLSGTHGKTTSTSMMSLITMEAGKDPTVMVGANLPAIGGNLRIGNDDVFVAESCEYCNSFLSFHPTVAVVLNVDADHLDFFKDINDIIHSFHQFCLLTPKDGLVVVNGDEPNALKAVEGIDRRVITFGSTSESDVYPTDVTIENGYYRFVAMYNGKKYGTIQLSVPGYHNMMNALACCAVSIFLGLENTAVKEGLRKFTGSGRRFQLTGKFHGATVVDDYAHHPSEMKATLKAAAQMNYNRILCVFQPHTYSRTQALLPEFVEALKLCDQAILVDIYAARETNTYGVSSKDIADQLDNGVYCGTFANAISYLNEHVQEGDLILTMGAGDVYKIGDVIVEKK
jgi:UDP-N-acetylmuramate--alanine ligase